jgi:hypothetical protein
VSVDDSNSSLYRLVEQLVFLGSTCVSSVLRLLRIPYLLYFFREDVSAPPYSLMSCFI